MSTLLAENYWMLKENGFCVNQLLIYPQTYFHATTLAIMGGKDTCSQKNVRFKLQCSTNCLPIELPG